MEKEILARAYDIVGEFGWTQRAFGRTDEGNETTYLDPRATSFCSMGLIGRAAHELNAPLDVEEVKAVHAFRFAAEIPDGMSVTEWNDNVATEDAVKDALRRAAGLPEPQTEVLFTEDDASLLEAVLV